MGVWLGARPALASPAQAAYVCPMHANIVQDHPGSCPSCGMDLVALKESGGEGARRIHVDTATQHKLGVRLRRPSTGSSQASRLATHFYYLT